MAHILETIMLICFGISWPMTVIKNIKAKSAKGMSLPFILMICSGYIAGIAGKIISGDFSIFVMAVYVINLVIVSSNIVIYFINKHYDRLESGEADRKSAMIKNIDIKPIAGKAEAK